VIVGAAGAVSEGSWAAETLVGPPTSMSEPVGDADADRSALHSNRTSGPNAQSDETGHRSSCRRWVRARRRPGRSAGDSAVHTMLPRQVPLILCCLWRSDSSAVTVLVQYPAGRLSRFALILADLPVGALGRGARPGGVVPTTGHRRCQCSRMDRDH